MMDIDSIDFGKNGFITRPEKRRIIDRFVNAEKSLGLEIGCNLLPFFRKSENYNIEYIETVDTEGLRQRCIRNGKNPTLVEDIDYVFEPGRTVSEITGRRCEYDYVITSHVIEHMPDLVRHFREIHEVLKDGGIYACVAPDKNFCSDTVKPPSSIGRVIEAYLNKSTRPSLSSFIDAVRLNVKVDGLTHPAWSVDKAGALVGIVEDQKDRVLKVLKDGDFPADWYGHNWVFTPHSFLNIFFDLKEYGLCGLELLDIIPTFFMDFIVILRKGRRDGGLDLTSAMHRLESFKYTTKLPTYYRPDQFLLD